MAWTRNRECVATKFELINATSSLIILGKSQPESASIQIRSIKTANFIFIHRISRLVLSLSLSLSLSPPLISNKSTMYSTEQHIS